MQREGFTQAAHGADDHAAQAESQHAAQHGTEEEHIHLPPPSIWPVTMALGIALGLTGIAFTYVISVVGLVMIFWALVNWIQELRHEHH